MKHQKSTSSILVFESPDVSICNFINVSVRHDPTLRSLCTMRRYTSEFSAPLYFTNVKDNNGARLNKAHQKRLSGTLLQIDNSTRSHERIGAEN